MPAGLQGVEKEREIRESVIEDSEKQAEENGALFVFKKINGRALELAGAVDR
jgi:hypothetical protein